VCNKFWGKCIGNGQRETAQGTQCFDSAYELFESCDVIELEVWSVSRPERTVLLLRNENHYAASLYECD
jgi:hypothetical protein